MGATETKPQFCRFSDETWANARPASVDYYYENYYGYYIWRSEWSWNLCDPNGDCRYDYSAPVRSDDKPNQGKWRNLQHCIKCEGKGDISCNKNECPEKRGLLRYHPCPKGTCRKACPCKRVPLP